MADAVRTALDVDGVRAAYFWQGAEGLTGVVYDEETGQEYDVRQVRPGWNVNDDAGRNFRALTLRGAIRKARRANRTERSC